MTSAEMKIHLLTEALKGLRRGECFCQVAIGNPMTKNHSAACVAATAALNTAVSWPSQGAA